MATTEVKKTKKGQQASDWTEVSTQEAEIIAEERLEETELAENTYQIETAGRLISKIEGIELMREGVYNVDLEKTVKEMFLVIQKMETQLERVLSINTFLEKDLNYSRARFSELKAEKSELLAKISRMEMETPSKRELQVELDQILEERNVAEQRIRELTQKGENISKKVIEVQNRIGELEEEKKDAISEINFLESKLNISSKRLAQDKLEINRLNGETLAHREKIKTLEEEITVALGDKYDLLKEFNGSKKVIADLHSALTGKKLQTKKALYGAGETKEE